ncbi:hypothetical protein MMC28_008822 [Mycoblastus sanguinarius]|nr:hypothetical protein [Mycoblastus sanguinarius]
MNVVMDNLHSNADCDCCLRIEKIRLQQEAELDRIKRCKDKGKPDARVLEMGFANLAKHDSKIRELEAEREQSAASFKVEVVPTSGRKSTDTEPNASPHALVTMPKNENQKKKFKASSLDAAILQDHKEKRVGRPSGMKMPFWQSLLRMLLVRYDMLDAISNMQPDTINTSIVVVHAELPSRLIAENLASVSENTPKSWLAIRRMMPNFYANVLQAISKILFDAIFYSEEILFHTPSALTIAVNEQRLTELLDCIRARKYVILMLQRQIQRFTTRFVSKRVDGAPTNGSTQNLSCKSLLRVQIRKQNFSGIWVGMICLNNPNIRRKLRSG